MFRYKKAKETSIRKYRYNKCVYIRAQTLKMVNKRIGFLLKRLGVACRSILAAFAGDRGGVHYSPPG